MWSIKDEIISAYQRTSLKPVPGLIIDVVLRAYAKGHPVYIYTGTRRLLSDVCVAGAVQDL